MPKAEKDRWEKLVIWPIATLLLLFLAFSAFRSCGHAIPVVNHNDIRGDLDALINQKFHDNPKLYAIARQMAKTYQNEIDHPDTAERQAGLNVVTCLDALFPDRSGEVLREIEAMAANTPERMKALIHFNARSNGQVLSEPPLEQACSFDPLLLK